MNILDLSAEEILRINKPEKIFTKENLKNMIKFVKTDVLIPNQ